MKRFFTLLLLAGAVSAAQAQKLQKTTLQIPELRLYNAFSGGYANVYGFGSDEKNYYVCQDMHYGGVSLSFFIINKKFTSPVKQCPIKGEKGDHFLKILLLEDDVVILLARHKKSEQKSQIIKQTYGKTTGKFKKETAIASFPMSKSEYWLASTTISPDKTKTGILFMIANKKNDVDSYYAALLNQNGEVEWDVTHDLEISNESFSVQDFTVTNNGDLYIAFCSEPEKIKKATDKNLYIDLVFLTDGIKEKMTIPIKKYQVVEVKLQPLKNGEVYLAALFAEDNKTYETEFLSMVLNGNNFNDNKSHTKEIKETNTHVRVMAGSVIPTKFLYRLGIERVLELDNGNIAVVCEQAINASYMVRSGNMVSTAYLKVRGSVTTFFVNGDDASVEDVSTMEKYQLKRHDLNFPAKSLHLSIFPFVYGNKVGYIFNDCLKKYTTPEKYKGTSFKNIDGKDVAIVLSTQASGEKAELKLLSGNVAAGRLFRQILFEESDKLIVFTQSKKGAYIETLSLP